VLPALRAGGSPQSAERVEQVLAKKPAALRKPLVVEMQNLRTEVAQRQCALQLPGSATPASGGGEAAAETDGAAPAPAADPNAAPPGDSSKPAAAPTANDSDGDGTPNAADGCPDDPLKSKPGICGCGTPDTDSDGDGTPDCHDQCPNERGAAVDKGCPPNAAATNRKSGLTMVRVAGGTFNMGSPDTQTGREADECPHSMTVGSFAIGQYEVTQADWREVMGANPSHNQDCDECPVENVSWNQVQDFLKNLRASSGKQYRLPTEAEWEYAARGGSKSQNYDFAGSDRPFEVAWFRVNFKQANSSGSQKTTRPVGTRKPNELGLCDMSGNVWEWCSDFYKAYPGCASAYGEGQFPALRGGGWKDETPDCRTARRFGSGGTGVRMNHVGLRLAMD
jgi:formylglycine-generating enzyme required for sulfatase activity